jgi:uncharacterized protein
MISAVAMGHTSDIRIERGVRDGDADVREPPCEGRGKAREFFTSIGFSFDDHFTDENATRMIVSGDTSVMLLVGHFFEGFIAPQDVADTSRSREVIVGLSSDSRQHVDELTDKALAAGANELGEPQDEGFMYMRGFRDLDGPQWSFIDMDLSAIPRG